MHEGSRSLGQSSVLVEDTFQSSCAASKTKTSGIKYRTPEYFELSQLKKISRRVCDYKGDQY